MKKDYYKIGPGNPLIGRRVEVIWLKAWGKKPRGFVARGVLQSTFVARSRALIGQLQTDRGTISCPWSRNYIEVREVG